MRRGVSGQTGSVFSSGRCRRLNGALLEALRPIDEALDDVVHLFADMFAESRRHVTLPASSSHVRITLLAPISSLIAKRLKI